MCARRGRAAMTTRRSKTPKPKGRKTNRAATGRRSAAADLRKQLDGRTRELAKTQKLLTESLQHQTATAEALKVISRTTFDLQSVLNTLLESAARLCEADHAWLFQREGNSLQWLASFGHSPDVHEKIRNYFSTFRVPIGRGAVTGRAALEGRTIHVSDVLADPEYTLSDVQQIGSYRAALGVPLLRKGEVIGVIFVAKPEPQPFTEKQIELVTTF